VAIVATASTLTLLLSLVTWHWRQWFPLTGREAHFSVLSLTLSLCCLVFSLVFTDPQLCGVALVFSQLFLPCVAILGVLQLLRVSKLRRLNASIRVSAAVRTVEQQKKESSSWRLGVLFVVLLLLALVLVSIPRFTSPNRCTPLVLDVVISIVFIVLYAGTVIMLLFCLKGHKDIFKIMAEQRERCALYCLCQILYCVFSLLDIPTVLNWPLLCAHCGHMLQALWLLSKTMSSKTAPASSMKRKSGAKVSPVIAWETWEISLEDFLQHSGRREYFAEFLVWEFSSENLTFWNGVNDFRQLPPDKLPQEANKIFNQFIKEGAPMQVNVIGTRRKVIADAIEKPASISNSLFDQAQGDIFKLMNKDTWPRFQKQDLYQKMWSNELHLMEDLVKKYQSK